MRKLTDQEQAIINRILAMDDWDQRTQRRPKRKKVLSYLGHMTLMGVAILSIGGAQGWLLAQIDIEQLLNLLAMACVGASWAGVQR